MGRPHYRPRSVETNTLLLQIFERHRLEATSMPNLLEQDGLFNEMSGVEVLKRLTEETIERIIRETPTKELLKHLSPDELLAALSPEVQAALAQRLKDYQPPPNPAGREPEPGEGKA